MRQSRNNRGRKIRRVCSLRNLYGEEAIISRKRRNQKWFLALRESKKMIILSILRRYRYIKELDKIVFPEKPIPIKIVVRGASRWSPASYWKNAKSQRDKMTKEWYTVTILARDGNDFTRAIHEVRHRVQWHYPDLPLFTKEKLLETQRSNPQQSIQQIIAYLEAVKTKRKEALPEKEQDAIIIEKLVEQKCRGLCNPLKTASHLIKKQILSSPLFSSP